MRLKVDKHFQSVTFREALDEPFAVLEVRVERDYW